MKSRNGHTVSFKSILVLIAQELDREQIDEVIDQWNEMTEYAGGDWLAIGLRNAIGAWENENDEYLI